MQKTVSIKERLAEFLSYKKIGQDKFGKIVGVSRGWANNVGDSIRKTTLDKIKEVFPELNTTWLITGEGEMLKDKTLEGVNNVNLKSNEEALNIINFKNEAEMNEEFKLMRKSLKLAYEKIDQLEQENESLRRELEAHAQKKDA